MPTDKTESFILGALRNAYSFTYFKGKISTLEKW